MKDKKVENYVAIYEYYLAKYQFIQSKYPGATVHATYAPVTFSSKRVNPKYTKFTISKGDNTLYIEPFLEEKFIFNGKEEMIRVYCQPRRNRLAHIVYDTEIQTKFGWTNKVRKSDKGIITFTPFKDNLSDRNLNDDCWNECRAAIMKYIKDNPNCTLETKNLDHSLKKLMIFN